MTANVVDHLPFIAHNVRHFALLRVNQVLADQLKCSGDTKPSKLPPCRLGIQTATERIEVGLRGKV